MTAFAWAGGDLDLRMPVGEDGHQFYERYDGAIAELRGSGGESVVAVSHGAAIRTWVAARCENTGGDFAGDHQLDNTGAAVLRSTRRGWVLVDWIPTPIGGGALADPRAVDPTGQVTTPG